MSDRPAMPSSLTVPSPIIYRMTRGIRAAIVSFIIISIIFGFTGGDSRTGSPVVIWGNWSAPSHERIDVRLDQETTNQLLIVDRLIRARTEHDDFIIALPCLSMFGIAVERRNPLYYIWLTPDVVREGVEDSVIQDLYRSSPPFILMFDFPIDGRRERRFSYYAPTLFEWIQRNYVPVRSLDETGNGDLFYLMQHEKGVISIDIVGQLINRTLTPASVEGSVRCERLALGHGKLPYLMMRPNSSILIDIEMPVSDELDLAFFKPEVVSTAADMRRWRDEYLITFTIKDSETPPLDLDNCIDSQSFIICETSKMPHEPAGQYCPCSKMSGKRTRIEISCALRSDSPLLFKDTWCAIGFIRIVARQLSMTNGYGPTAPGVSSLIRYPVDGGNTRKENTHD